MIAENDLKQLQESCKSMGIDFYECTVMPFSDKLPDFPIDDDIINIYYGSTTLIDNIYDQLDRPVGVFFDREKYSMANYITKWGDHMLNAGAQITTLGEFAKQCQKPDMLWFIRPDDDSKSFAGQAMTFEEIQQWETRLQGADNMKIGEDTKILAGPAWRIRKEWRNYIVGDEVVASTLYREDFRLKKSADDIPSDMIQFVKDRMAEYRPHDIFAMDVALCGDEYYIIECGCMNSVGFYAASIPDIVKAISEYISEKYCS